MPIPVIYINFFQRLITCEERALTAVECLSMPPLKTRPIERVDRNTGLLY